MQIPYAGNFWVRSGSNSLILAIVTPYMLVLTRQCFLLRNCSVAGKRFKWLYGVMRFLLTQVNARLSRASRPACFARFPVSVNVLSVDLKVFYPKVKIFILCIPIHVMILGHGNSSLFLPQKPRNVWAISFFGLILCWKSCVGRDRDLTLQIWSHTISHDVSVRKMMIWRDFRIHKQLNLTPTLAENVYAILAEIDGVKNSWHITEKLLS